MRERQTARESATMRRRSAARSYLVVVGVNVRDMWQLVF